MAEGLLKKRKRQMDEVLEAIDNPIINKESEYKRGVSTIPKPTAVERMDQNWKEKDKYKSR